MVFLFFLVNEARLGGKDWKVNMMNSRRWALDFYPALLFLCPQVSFLTCRHKCITSR